MNTLTIPNDLLHNSTPLAVMLYATIGVYVKYAVTEEARIYMPREKLQYDIYGEKFRDTFQVRKIMEGISELEELGVLKYSAELKGVLIYRDEFWPQQNYVTIYGKELKKIRGLIEPGYYQWLLFYYFCTLIGSFKGGANFGFMPQKYFAEIIDVSMATIRSYNRQLEKAKLIYFKSARPKLYCRYENRVDIFN